MHKAFVYLRVSGISQVGGDGFDRQLEACEEYATREGLEIAGVFREEGVSGTKDLANRPALCDLLEELSATGTKTIIIEKLDRLARDLMVSETIIAEFIRRGFTLISVAEPDICSNDPSRKLIRQIFSAIAEFDRAMTVLKLRGARRRMKSKLGRCEGQKPYGTLPGEEKTLAMMRSLRDEGMNPKNIAILLNVSGIRTRSNAPWHQSTIAKILSRSVLHGIPEGLRMENTQVVENAQIF